jgi:5-methylcytosine-specific restriction protein A
MAILKLCKCGKCIPAHLSRCEDCQAKYTTERDKRYKKFKKQYDKNYDTNKRDKRSTAFYKSREWDRVRRAAISRDKFLCQHCLKNKKFTPYNVVDHIVPIKVNWELRLTLSNLQCLCHVCHNRKTKEDEIKYKG